MMSERHDSHTEPENLAAWHRFEDHHDRLYDEVEMGQMQVELRLSTSSIRLCKTRLLSWRDDHLTTACIWAKGILRFDDRCSGQSWLQPTLCCDPELGALPSTEYAAVQHHDVREQP